MKTSSLKRRGSGAGSAARATVTVPASVVTTPTPRPPSPADWARTEPGQTASTRAIEVKRTSRLITIPSVQGLRGGAHAPAGNEIARRLPGGGHTELLGKSVAGGLTA